MRFHGPPFRAQKTKARLSHVRSDALRFALRTTQVLYRCSQVGISRLDSDAAVHSTGFSTVSVLCRLFRSAGEKGRSLFNPSSEEKAVPPRPAVRSVSGRPEREQAGCQLEQYGGCQAVTFFSNQAIFWPRIFIV